VKIRQRLAAFLPHAGRPILIRPSPWCLYSLCGRAANKAAINNTHSLEKSGGLSIDFACLTPGIGSPSNSYELGVMMRSLTDKSLQTVDQYSSNAHQSRAGRVFAEPVIAFLENKPNNFIGKCSG
jgi:hypothetical protein